MKYSFAELGKNILTRKFGGTTVGVADPYLTGYHFVHFENLPAGITNYTSSLSSGLSSLSDIQAILSASCLSVTPPGGTLNKVELTGLGGVRWAVPGNIDYGNSVSVKFLEFSGTPILDIMHSWVKLIRDYRTGVSNIEGVDSSGFTKKNYAALMYYWTSNPALTEIEFFACYDGIFPARDPQDMFTSDVESIGRLDVEIEFNVDYAWHEDWVKTRCADFFEAVIEKKATINDQMNK